MGVIKALYGIHFYTYARFTANPGLCLMANLARETVPKMQLPIQMGQPMSQTLQPVTVLRGSIGTRVFQAAQSTVAKQPLSSPETPLLTAQHVIVFQVSCGTQPLTLASSTVQI